MAATTATASSREVKRSSESRTVTRDTSAEVCARHK
jgi:hypothetical protein